MKLAIAGAAGRMGRVLTRIVQETEGAEVAGGLESAGSPHIGADLGTLAGLAPLGVKVGSDAPGLLAKVDGIIDFTVPKATLELVRFSAEAGIVHVIGTTGIAEASLAAISEGARRARIVQSGNMSLGVNLLASLVRKVAAALGEDFDIEILEMHHRHKIDAPSGTALLLGKAAALGRGVDLKSRSVRSRDGETGARKPGDIGFAALRGGSVVGEHTVLFAGASERIELSHRAESRDIFARGAVRAALWAKTQKPGLYSMAQVLGLE
ncbi:MAG TPA: 4-hydroxy-tetrahydrodipicolinate reductase [Aestuariivirga sp.]|nr:4-hydroxy-tetrahydrodipicolinate reductase [Aestuariivirga sp.]